MNTAIILAGGLGTRLRSEVKGLPKPMAPIQGKPFLELLINNCISQGINKFILSVGYLSQTIQDYFGSNWQGCEINYSIEEVPLGTGGGILQASKLIVDQQSPFLILNGDSYFDINYQQLLAFHLRKGAAISMGLFSSTDTSRYMGLELNREQRIVNLRCDSNSDICIVNGGIYITNTLALKSFYTKIPEFLSWESSILPAFLRQNIDVYGCHFDKADFIDIGIPADYQKAQNLSFLNGSKNV